MYRAFLALVFFGISVSSVQAASLYIDPGTITINRGDAVTVAVRVATDEETGECINAVDGIISYSANLQPVDVSTGDSIISLWVEPPVINKENRTITFAGGIPNGYCGRIPGDPRLSNVITEIIFRSPGLQIGGGDEVNSASVAISPESKVYLNDGFGTLASLRTFDSTITLERTPGPTIVDTWRSEVAADTLLPQPFGIELVQDGTTFAGDWYIVFNTTDKETGISHYEVMGEPASEWGRFSWGRADAPWISARSPYVLKDQSLNSTIRVKAIDKAGNEYIATLVPEASQRSFSDEQVLLLVLGGSLVVLALVFLGIVLWWWRRRRARRHADASASDPSNEPTL